MAEKYLVRVNGLTRQQEAQTTSAGAGDAGKIVALDGAGKLDVTLLPTGIGDDTGLLAASEDLVAGDFVNIWDDAGTAKVRKADATTSGKEANGFVLDAVTSGNNATVYFEGVNDQLAGLSPGQRYYLAKVAGTIIATPLSQSGGATGNLDQYIGRAISATALTFEPEAGVVLA